MQRLTVQGKIDKKDRSRIAQTGIDLSAQQRSASFIQKDNAILASFSLLKGVEILPLEEAEKKYSRRRIFWGEAFAKTERKFNRHARGGYFVRVQKGVRVKFPIQACLFLKKSGFRQRVHNIIVVEEGAEAYFISGCASSKATSESYHLGISEYFIGRGAYLNFTMIHAWGKDIEVEPQAAAIVEKGGNFISNYISLKPVKNIKMDPVAFLEGEKARVSFNSLVISHPSSFQDIGASVYLGAKEGAAEVISRTVSLGGRVIARGYIKALAKQVKGHIECRGLIVPSRGTISSLPQIETEFRDVSLTHEAAIGKISREEIEYLAARGIPQDEAQALIIRGFMDTDILGLPKSLEEEVRRLTQKTLEKGS